MVENGISLFISSSLEWLIVRQPEMTSVRQICIKRFLMFLNGNFRLITNPLEARRYLVVLLLKVAQIQNGRRDIGAYIVFAVR